MISDQTIIKGRTNFFGPWAAGVSTHFAVIAGDQKRVLPKKSRLSAIF
jgi:hypothetical protein